MRKLIVGSLFVLCSAGACAMGCSSNNSSASNNTASGGDFSMGNTNTGGNTGTTSVAAGGNNGQTNSSAVTLPDTAIGKYDVALSGDWIGTSLVTIQSSSAVLQSLHATRSSWVADLPGPYDTKSVTDAGGLWHFQWDEQVSTQGTLVRQQIEFVVADAGFTSTGFEGQYTHTSDLTGTHGGSLSGTRQ